VSHDPMLLAPIRGHIEMARTGEQRELR